ncbi:MAG TPA: enoyl-CoA hydratase-related protein [Bdellovibrionota bacterium]|nr:enoyl-CoA hydratase-related protein [Bdellovibrionota bacterium]
MEQIPLEIERNGPVAFVKLNRPEVHNAFDARTIRELSEAFSNLAREEAVRVLVLSGEGKNFCAGADVNWMKSSIHFSAAENEKDARDLHEMLGALYRFPKPTVARVHGAAFGGGVGLISGVDVAIAASDALLSISEVRLGILPAVISPFVTRKIGVANLRTYGLSAKKFSAEEAFRIGLVQEVVPDSELDAAVDRWVNLFLEGGPHAQATLKVLTEETYGLGITQTSKQTVKTIAKIRTGEEGQEGLKAFLEKRPPTWRTKR